MKPHIEFIKIYYYVPISNFKRQEISPSIITIQTLLLVSNKLKYSYIQSSKVKKAIR